MAARTRTLLGPATRAAGGTDSKTEVELRLAQLVAEVRGERVGEGVASLIDEATVRGIRTRSLCTRVRQLPNVHADLNGSGESSLPAAFPLCWMHVVNE